MLPELGRIRKTTSSISVFRGLNRSDNTGFSRVSNNSSTVYTEFEDMKNMSDDQYPQLTTRHGRTRLYSDREIISNILAVDDSLVYLTADKILHTGNSNTLIKEIATTAKHNLVLFGHKVIILPEKIEFHLSDNTYGFIEASSSVITFAPGGSNSISTIFNYDYDDNYKCAIDKVILNTTITPKKKLCLLTAHMDFTDESSQRIYSHDVNDNSWIYDKLEVGDCVEVYEKEENDSILYMCTGKTVAPTGLDYSYPGGYIRKFVEINNCYIKLRYYSSKSNNNEFKINDYIKISNITDSILPDWRYGDKSYIDILNNNYFKIYDIGYERDSIGQQINYIVIKANIKSSIPYIGDFKFERVMPTDIDFDKMVEVNNRLWTCSSKSNEIYCCKQGDAKNWFAYSDGIASDSFGVTVGCEGEFTGIAKYNDSVIFFKENHSIRIFGTKPSNYTLAEYNISGIEKGSGKSAVWVNGTLFYKAKRGIVAYSVGAQPALISYEAFGTTEYKNAVAGRKGDKYVVSLECTDGNNELMVYDTKTGLWHKEDDTQLISAVTYNDELYYIDGKSQMLMAMTDKANILDNIALSDEDELQRESQFGWMVQTGDLYDSDFDTKYISRIAIGVKPEPNTSVKVLAQYSDNGIWYEIGNILYDEKKPRVFPVVLRRAEYLKLRIVGTGRCSIYGIDITYAKGSDIR